MENIGNHRDFWGSVQQQAEPGDHIFAVLEGQAQLLDDGENVDAVALHTGVHLLREPAAFPIEPGAALALGAALGGEDVGLDALLPEEIPHLVGDGLVLRPGGQGLFNIGDIPDLGDGGDHQGVLVAHALGLAGADGAHRGGTGPAGAVHGALVLADPADPVGKLQLAGGQKMINVQGQLRKLRLQKFFVQHNSSKIRSQPWVMSSQV